MQQEKKTNCGRLVSITKQFMQNKLRHWKYLHAELIRLILCFFYTMNFILGTTYLISNHILSGKDIEITSKQISLCFVNLQLITKYYMELLPKKITIISIHIIGMYTDCLHIYYIWQMILPLLPDVLS